MRMKNVLGHDIEGIEFPPVPSQHQETVLILAENTFMHWVYIYSADLTYWVDTFGDEYRVKDFSPGDLYNLFEALILSRAVNENPFGFSDLSRIQNEARYAIMHNMICGKEIQLLVFEAVVCWNGEEDESSTMEDCNEAIKRGFDKFFGFRSFGKYADNSKNPPM